MALVITPGSASADSYADLDFAETYFQGTTRLTAWNALGDGDAKEAALRDAMPFMEALAWVGNRVTTTQALEWPRIGGSSRRWPYGSSGGGLIDLRGRSWDSDEVPEPVKKAQCEMALAVGQNPAILGGIHKNVAVDFAGVTMEQVTSRDFLGLCPMGFSHLAGLLVAGNGSTRLLKC